MESKQHPTPVDPVCALSVLSGAGEELTFSQLTGGALRASRCARGVLRSPTGCAYMRVIRCLCWLCTPLALVVVLVIVRWEAWMLIDVYPLQGCAAAWAHDHDRRRSTRDPTRASHLSYLVLNLKRSQARLDSTAHELSRCGIRNWTRVTAVDTTTAGKSLHLMASTFIPHRHAASAAAVHRVAVGLQKQWHGHVDGYLLALQSSLVRALRKGQAQHQARPGLRWFVVFEDDVSMDEDFEQRFLRLANALPSADVLWLDKRSVLRSISYAEPSCCTAAIAINVNAVDRLAKAMTPGSDEITRHIARQQVRESSWPPSPWPQQLQLQLPRTWWSGVSWTDERSARGVRESQEVKYDLVRTWLEENSRVRLMPAC